MTKKKGMTFSYELGNSIEAEEWKEISAAMKDYEHEEHINVTGRL